MNNSKQFDDKKNFNSTSKDGQSQSSNASKISQDERNSGSSAKRAPEQDQDQNQRKDSVRDLNKNRKI